MKFIFKITERLLAQIRADLQRAHPFAFERVGFVSAGLSAAGDNVLILAREYQPILDQDYLKDGTVGARIGPEAIRKAMQWALVPGTSIIHIHSHGGVGKPAFSEVDIASNNRVIPDLLKVNPRCLHGALVLSNEYAVGEVWIDRRGASAPIDQFIEVGGPIRKWSGL